MLYDTNNRLNSFIISFYSFVPYELKFKNLLNQRILSKNTDVLYLLSNQIRKKAQVADKSMYTYLASWENVHFEPMFIIRTHIRLFKLIFVLLFYVFFFK